MPRPVKKRTVCAIPENCEMIPAHRCSEDAITMTVDEYETIRLIDLVGATQESCALQMNVARTTVQGIYNSARKKLADALINRKKLIVAGGDYKQCECFGAGCKSCPKACHRMKGTN